MLTQHCKTCGRVSFVTNHCFYMCFSRVKMGHELDANQPQRMQIRQLEGSVVIRRKNNVARARFFLHLKHSDNNTNTEKTDSEKDPANVQKYCKIISRMKTCTGTVCYNWDKSFSNATHDVLWDRVCTCLCALCAFLCVFPARWAVFYRLSTIAELWLVTVLVSVWPQITWRCFSFSLAGCFDHNDEIIHIECHVCKQMSTGHRTTCSGY